MNILFDIVHPAHVHFYRNIIRTLEARGHAIKIISRKKDVTCELLTQLGFQHTPVGRAGQKTRVGQLLELVTRDIAISVNSLKFRPDIIATRNPSGVQAARLIGATGIFDTDDGFAAGIHFKASAPFAHYITTPRCIDEDYGPKHVKYPGFKQLAYLHPSHFKPDKQVIQRLGIKEGEKYFLVRFVAMAASHDQGEQGLPFSIKEDLIERLRAKGRVFISSESELPEKWKPMQLSLHPLELHDVLAFSSMYVGDSQTMAAEAAFLGVPGLRVSSFVGRLHVQEILENKYKIAFGFRPDEGTLMLDKLSELLSLENPRAALNSGVKQLFADHEDIAAWYVNFIEKIYNQKHAVKTL